MTILNLSVSDTVACLSRVASSVIVKWFEIEVTDNSKKYTEFFWQFGVNSSFLFLTLLTVQTYVIIKYPIRSRLAMTKKKVVFMIGTVWTVSLVLALLEINDISKDKRMYFWIANISVLELATIIQIIMKIFIIREIFLPRDPLLNNTRNKQQKEVAKTIIIMIFVLIVTALPYFIAKQIEYITRICDGNYDLTVKFAYYYEPIAMMNFVVNPIVYSLRLKDYRKSLFYIFIYHKKANQLTLTRDTSKTVSTKV